MGTPHRTLDLGLMMDFEMAEFNVIVVRDTTVRERLYMTIAGKTTCASLASPVIQTMLDVPR